jgi:hypothetical protein
MEKLQQKHDMQKAAFMQKAEQQARAEELQYQTMLKVAQRNIDMQMETQDYARKKQMLSQTMNMINDSNEFDAREKQELKTQAMAKYADLGSGITPSSFDKTNSYEALMAKGAYKVAMLKDLQKQVDGGLNPQVAENISIGLGMPGTQFLTPQERQNQPLVDAAEQFEEAQKRLNLTGFNWDGEKKVLLDDRGREIEKGTPHYETAKRLHDDVYRARDEMNRLRGLQDRSTKAGKFMEDLEKSPGLKDALNYYTPEEVFEKWYESRYGGKAPQKDKGKWTPLKNNLLENVYPGLGAYNTAKQLMGK